MDIKINFLYVFLAALVPMILGFIWYNPKVLGKVWMEAAGITEDKMKGGNMAVIFGVSLVLSFLLAMSLMPITIHQMGVFSTLATPDTMADPINSEGAKYFKDFMMKHGSNFRTFKHGMFHGILAGLFLVLPVMGTNALFERKGFKYIAMNCGYWILCLGIMGGVICQWGLSY